MVAVKGYPPFRWAVHLPSCGIQLELVRFTLAGIPEEVGTALVARCDLLPSCQSLTLVDKL